MAVRGGQVRIIGGKWKGRKLRFAALPGLRPTPEKLRETLFNWLGSAVEGAKCLDLCAGSGALGIESLSRGAMTVDFVESGPRTAADLEKRLMQLGASESRVWTQDVRRFVSLSERKAMRWDLVFLDPPFAGTLLSWLFPRVLDLLACDDSRLCLEAPADLQLGAGPWRELRVSTAGNTSLRLIGRCATVVLV